LPGLKHSQLAAPGPRDEAAAKGHWWIPTRASWFDWTCVAIGSGLTSAHGGSNFTGPKLSRGPTLAQPLQTLAIEWQFRTRK